MNETPILKSTYGWLQEPEYSAVTIAVPAGGWKRGPEGEHWWYARITREEFLDRLNKSEVVGVPL